MIFRAVLLIGLAALLAPHEPDLGFGRPGGGISLPSLRSLSSLPSARGLLSGAGLTELTIRGRRLSDVKAEIDAAVKARHTRIITL